MNTCQDAWRWVASGKHPSIKDYISIGQMFPLAASFSEWMSKGYSEQKSRNTSRRGPCSWRFWVKGRKQNELSCGLLKDSSDSIGRPYPLLAMGGGFLDDWEENWELVPLACENIWTQMEKITAHPFADVQSIERELAALRPPLPQWFTFRKEYEKDLRENSSLSLSDVELFCGKIRNLSEKKEGYIIFDPLSDCDIFNSVEFVEQVLKENHVSTPSVIFIGGTVDMSCLAFFRRPLTVSDFSTLWSALPQRQKIDTT